MKAVVAAFNQEKALVGAFSVIVQLVVEPMDRFTALFEEVLAGLVTLDGENKKLVLDQVFREFLTRDLLTPAAGSPPDIAACQRFVVQFAIQVSIYLLH